MTQTSDTFVIGEREGYAPKVGVLVSMLTNSRRFLMSATRDLTQAQLDSQPTLAPNSIGALLAHLCAAENMFQRITFEGRRFNEQELGEWGATFELKPCSKNQGRTLEAYLADLSTSRSQTLAEMKNRGDDWLETPITFMKNPANYHYYWFHYLQDEVRHTGQITLLRKHLIVNPQPDFNPYAFT